MTESYYIITSHVHGPCSQRQCWWLYSEAEKAKTQKYILIKFSAPVTTSSRSMATETTGIFGPEAISSVSQLRHRIRAEYGELRSWQFLLQVLAVAIQHGNAATSRPLGQCFHLTMIAFLGPFSFSFSFTTANSGSQPINCTVCMYYYYICI